MSDENLSLTGQQMFEIRARALQHAATTHGSTSVPEVLHAAGSYLQFLLEGQPIYTIGQTVRETQGVPPQAPAPDSTPVQAPKAPGRPRKPAAAPAPAQAAPPATAPAATAPGASPAPAAPVVAATPAAPATPQAKAAPAAGGSPATVAPPTTIQEAALALKALVQGTRPGEGRNAAVALLAEFGGTLLSQVPATKLAEFKRRCETAHLAAAAPTAASPGDDLLA